MVVVEFLCFVDEDDENVVADYPTSALRPIPPCTTVKYQIKDEVDVRVDDCWWEGIVEKIEGDHTLTVRIHADGKKIRISPEQLRAGVVWGASEWSRRQ